MEAKIKDVNARAKPDSGAEVNVMAEHQFETLTNRIRVKRTQQPSRIKLSFMQTELPVKGEFTDTIRNQVRGRKINSPPLSGKKN